MTPSTHATDDVTIEPDETARSIREYVLANPDLIYDEYESPPDSLNGGCYALSEAYFHARGGTTSALDIYCLSWSDVDPELVGTHWYLRDIDLNEWVDLGLDRIEEAADIPFEQGTRRAFLTGYVPSARANEILEALGIDIDPIDDSDPEEGA